MCTSRRRAAESGLKTGFLKGSSEDSHCQTFQKYIKGDFEDTYQMMKLPTNLRQLENYSFLPIRAYISHNPLPGTA